MEPESWKSHGGYERDTRPRVWKGPSLCKVASRLLGDGVPTRYDTWQGRSGFVARRSPDSSRLEPPNFPAPCWATRQGPQKSVHVKLSDFHTDAACSVGRARRTASAVRRMAGYTEVSETRSCRTREESREEHEREHRRDGRKCPHTCKTSGSNYTIVIY